MKQCIILLGLLSFGFLTVHGSSKSDIWQELHSSEPEMVAFASAYANPEAGVTVGEHGDSRYSLAEGSPWVMAQVPEKIRCRYSVDTVDNQFVLSRGNGGVALSEDGGMTWEMIFQNRIADISFCDRQNGWYMTSNLRLYRTSDGAENWEEISMPQGFGVPRASSVTSYDQAWLMDCDGNLFSTLNGGENWEQIHIESIVLEMGEFRPDSSQSTMQFVDENRGMVILLDRAVRHRWLICETSDGGETWNLEILQREYPGSFYISHDNHTLTLLEQVSGNPKVTVFGRSL